MVLLQKLAVSLSHQEGKCWIICWERILTRSRLKISFRDLNWPTIYPGSSFWSQLGTINMLVHGLESRQKMLGGFQLDWSKTKSIFIIVFLILDIFLLTLFINKYNESQYDFLGETKFEDRLQVDNIKYEQPLT